MTAELAVLQRLRCTEEATNAYGIDDSANVGANGIDVPFIEGSCKPSRDQELFDPKIASPLLEYQDKKIPGRATCGLSFDIPLHSHGVAIDGVNAIPTIANWALLRIMKAIYGATSATANGGARTVQAGSTTSVVNVTAGRGADWQAGDAIAVRVTGGAAGTIEAREVLSVTANTVTVVEQFSAVPVTGGVAYGCVTVYTIDDPQTSLQFVLEGTELDDRTVFCGMQGAPKFTLPAGSDVPKVSFDLKGSNWARLAQAAVSPATFTNMQMLVPVFNELHFTTISGTTVARTVLDQSAQTYEPAISYGPVRSGAAPLTNNIKRMRRQKVRPPLKASFTSIFEDATNEAARLAGTSKRLDWQGGNVPGGTLLLCNRQLQIVDAKDAVHESGIGGQTIPLEGRIPDSGTTPYTRSVSAWHFF